MKKRLFNNAVLYNLEGILFIGSCSLIVLLLVFFICFLKAKPVYYINELSFKIPVFNVPLKDEINYSESVKNQKITKNNLTIVLDKNGNLYFGDVGSFSNSQFYVVKIDETSKELDIEKVESDILRWIEYKKSKNQIIDNTSVIVVPDSNLELSSVLKVVSKMKEKGLIKENIILGNNIL